MKVIYQFKTVSKCEKERENSFDSFKQKKALNIFVSLLFMAKGMIADRVNFLKKINGNNDSFQVTLIAFPTIETRSSKKAKLKILKK